MAHYWILIFSFGVASPQYINTEAGDIPSEPLPYYLGLPYRTDYELAYQNDPYCDHDKNERTRRTVEATDKEKRWSVNAVEEKKEETPEAFTDDNSTEILNAMEKRSFSPWGGKRSDLERMWSWKRSPNIREPSMPKRVRFSPWGGKRSGQMIFKPETRNNRIISAAIPELTKIISNYPPGDSLSVAGMHFTQDKRQSIKVLPLNSQMDETNYREVPFKTFLESLPKLFKPGQTYSNLKKDGKRKLKFSAWGGKRAPPIIGPIWSPTSPDAKDAALDTIVLLRDPQKT
ncbi:uncharacterized protein LOC121735914 [Aricia agestis]|uniref:uncharacterized protein LOC121735914 n=1 Tax=Aricia agestis TaxID=91739 RepID=UPI001C205B66|nr:uncharacterized protein LOC121735914 [Aricia agestis]